MNLEQNMKFQSGYGLSQPSLSYLLLKRSCDQLFMDLDHLKGHVITVEEFLSKHGLSAKLERLDSVWDSDVYLNGTNLTSHSEFFFFVAAFF